jgi:RNA polymerase sigma factor (sigma-70 family)
MLLDAAPLDDAYTAQAAPQSGRRMGALRGRGRFGVLAERVVTNPSSGAVAPQATPQVVAQVDYAALMQRVRDAQDRAAFAQIFQHFAPRVKGFLMKSGSDAALAEELAQDVMATVWQKSAQFDAARASLSTWIFTIARNRRIDHFRRARRPEPQELDWGADAEPDQADVYLAAQETRRLTEALASLPEAQRAMIERAYFGDMSHSEIVAQTGLPLGTIKSRIRLALDRLRQTLSE